MPTGEEEEEEEPESEPFWPWAYDHEEPALSAVPAEEMAWYRDGRMIEDLEGWYDAKEKRWWRVPKCIFATFAAYEDAENQGAVCAKIDWNAKGVKRRAVLRRDVMESPKGKERRTRGVVGKGRNGAVLERERRKGGEGDNVEKWQGKISVVVDAIGLSVVGWRLMNAVAGEEEKRVEIDDSGSGETNAEDSEVSPLKRTSDDEPEGERSAKQPKKATPKTPASMSKPSTSSKRRLEESLPDEQRRISCRE